MRLLTQILTISFLLVCNLRSSAQSQEAPDFFVGKWTVLVKGTPQGDVKLVLSVEKKDTSLAAVILDSTGGAFAKVDKIVRNQTAMTAYFSALGYDLYLEMNKKDEDHLVGNLVGQFEAEAERIKSDQEKK